MTPLNKKLVRDLWHIRGQALAIAAVISGGIATLVMALGAQGSLQETRTAYYERYRFADVFAQAKRAPRHLLGAIEKLPGVAKVEGRIVHDIIIDVTGAEEPARGRVVSRIVGSPAVLNDVVIRRGRDLVRGRGDEVLVNEAFADAHGLNLGDILHGNLNERRRALRIVGIVLSPEFVYAIGPGEIVPDDRHFGVIWMDRDTLEAAYDLKGAFNNVIAKLSHDGDEAEVIAGIDRLLDRYGGTGAIGREDQDSDAFVASEMDQLGHLATIIPPIFLAVAAFLFNIVVSRVIETEREQIGLLKAFGYSNGEVGWHYMKFVMIIAALGVALGWAAGIWMGHAMTELYAGFFRFPFLYFAIDPATLAIGGLVGFGAAGLGTLAAVRRAVAIPPAVAMVPAPPSAYQSNLFERWGLARAFPATGRMILRHIVRWPLRSSLTVTGIALSVAILISTLFFIDAVNEMMDAHFFETERQDMSVTFVEHRTDGIRHNLDDLPGVMMAEPFRIVPTRMRHGRFEERVAIQGLQSDADLSLLVDKERRPVILPPEGLVISNKLAELLRAGEGDRVIVAALEGRRPVREIPILRVVQQYIGAAAYMERRALNRLMGEGDLVSGMHLKRDALAEAALFSQLKETPALLGLTVRQSAFETFDQMIDEHLNTMVFFYVTFAALIAIGVIYNSARISLSERGRELASLRVLGFTQREVGIILAGELAALTVIALPVGCLIGYGLAALFVSLFDTKLYRIPFVVASSTYGYSVLVVLAAATISSWIVLRRVAGLDLIAVLKTRE
ncbi:MAG: FtsX-like permease family protein [Alphaproteobacteria bacterium]|nr:FtsX-like permease family protein [Alphaproteobacteria bacterium]